MRERERHPPWEVAMPALDHSVCREVSRHEAGPFHVNDPIATLLLCHHLPQHLPSLQLSVSLYMCLISMSLQGLGQQSVSHDVPLRCSLSLQSPALPRWYQLGVTMTELTLVSTTITRFGGHCQKQSALLGYRLPRILSVTVRVD